MKPIQSLLCLAAVCLAGIAVAQVPQLVNFQGRVVVGNLNFDGTGQFKFALVNSNGTATYWSNDGTSSAGSPPATAVSVPVVKGLYSVLLGNAVLPNMGVLPATVFTNGDVRLRVWFSDGVNGFQLFAPDQRLAAVGYALMAGNVPDGSIDAAKLADGAVTLAKVGPDVKAGLGGMPSGGVVMTEDPDATNLLAGGFVKLPGVRVVTDEWEPAAADPGISFSSMAASPVWTGTEAYVFRESASSGPLASRYIPGSDTWHPLPTNGVPSIWEFKPVWIGNELMLIGSSPEGLLAIGYRPDQDSWRVANTNGAPYYSSWNSEVVWTGSQLLVLSSAPEGLRGGRYDPGTDTWLPVTTNGAPTFSSTGSEVVWTGTELIVLSGSPDFNGGRYRPGTDSWLPIATNGAPPIDSETKALWTGNTVVVLCSSTEGVRGARYSPAGNTWAPVATNDAPSFSLMDVKALWTGTEVLVWKSNLGMPEQRSGLYNPTTDRWRIVNPEVPRFGTGGAVPSPNPIWTGTEAVFGFSFDQTMYAYAGGRYDPTSDAWTGITLPPDKPSSSSISFVWTGAQALVFFQDMSAMRSRTYRWTPSRTLYLYRKP